jgi:tyrocidine synthetase-3
VILDIRLWNDVKQEDRFYPPEIPIFPYEPLKKFFQIVKSPETINEGVISLISLNVEDIAFKWSGWLLDFQTLHSLQIEKGRYLNASFFSGKLLHSCDPNLQLDVSTLTAYVIKPIKVFDILSIDYEYTEDKLYNQFTCSCGSSNCRGWISGKIKEVENE